MATRAGIYTRISSDREGEAVNVATQEADCRDLCERRGWIVEEVYTDNDITAADPRKARPAYDRLMSDVAAGRISAVAVYRDDRLHRRPYELEEFFQRCDDAGLTQLANVHGEYDLSNSDDVFRLRLQGTFAAHEVARMRERVTRKKRELADAGKYGGGLRPYGFAADGVTHVPEEAARIREAATRVLAGETLSEITNDWNRQAVPTVRTGHGWHTSMVKRLLVTPRTAGQRQHQGEILGPAIWKPVLDMATWLQCRALLNDPSRLRARRNVDYPAKGLLVCGLCKSMLKPMPRAGRRSYGCKSRTGGCGKVYIGANAVETYMWNVVKEIADSPELHEAAATEVVENSQRMRDLLAENEVDEEKLQKAVVDYANDEIDRNTFNMLTKTLNANMNGRRAEVAGLRGTSVFDRLGGEIAARWDTFTPDERRQLAEAIIQEIKVFPAIVQGRNAFDPRRLQVWLHWAGIMDRIDEDRIVGGYDDE